MFDWFENKFEDYSVIGWILWLPVSWFLYVTLFIWWPISVIIEIIKYLIESKKGERQ